MTAPIDVRLFNALKRLRGTREAIKTTTKLLEEMNERARISAENQKAYNEYLKDREKPWLRKKRHLALISSR